MPKVKAQQIPQKQVNIDDEVMRFCYSFPRYSYKQAKKLPFKRIQKMLKIAEKEKAKMLLELTLIISAPHTEKGEMVKELLDKYLGIVES